MSIILKNVRVAYPSIVNPAEPRGGQKEGKFETLLVLDKDAARVANAEVNRIFQENRGSMLKNTTVEELQVMKKCALKSLKKNSEAIQAAGVAGVSTKSKYRPRVIDGQKNDVGPEIITSGCYVNAKVTFFPYNNESQGIGCVLEVLQFIKPGESLGSVASIDDFEEIQNIDFEDDSLNF